MKRALLVTLIAACAAPAPKPEEKPVAAEKPAEPSTAAAPPSTPDAEFRAQAPAPGAPVEFHAPIPKELKLKNGLPVYFIERHEVPLVSIVLSVRSGADTEPKGKAGLASMALDLLDEGTSTRDAAAIARDLEDLAARYRTQADADSSVVGVTALASTVE